jgi:hypothetical protein
MANSLTPTLITVAVTAFGWYATYFYAKKKENRTRRLEIQLKYKGQQIEQLYGPLISLIEQIFNVWEVRQAILNGARYSEENQRQIKNFLWQRYFFPLHQEIRDLLRTKLYLLDGNNLPASFSKYLQHATQESCQHQIWSELKIDTSHVAGLPWPDGFHTDVRRTLDRLMNDYKSGLATLS